ncbi:MAG: hypothetical protein PHI53_01040 [Candidatus Pacebacteria bacterium]|nr:hypothetical protein [Candidatus Paceibacterota bacterium]
MITNRQENILNNLVEEYIKTAKPISSELLEKKYSFNFCPATIRSEMKALTDMGYLIQPHTSAGRIPTNKAYRFFVDKFMELNSDKDIGSFDIKELEAIKRLYQKHLKFAENLTKTIAAFSSNLAFVYLYNEDFLYKEGWKEVFKNPEFEEREFLESFIETVEDFEKNIKRLKEEKDNCSRVKIYIGREKSFLNSPEFSIVFSEGAFFDKGQGIMAILGPNRMAYDKNIYLIDSIIKELENYDR